jgi:AcrR family transcriptional regulator
MPHVSAEVRRELLVDAAIRVMIRDGVGAATTRAIVAEADMPLGAFHYCFRSKQELVEQVIATITNTHLDRALEDVTGEGSMEQRLLRGVRAYWDHVVRFPDEHRLTYELTQYASRRPGLREVAQRQYATYLAAHTEVLEALADAEHIAWSEPVPVLARYFTGLIDGITLLYLNEGDAAMAGQSLDLAAHQIASYALSA